MCYVAKTQISLKTDAQGLECFHKRNAHSQRIFTESIHYFIIPNFNSLIFYSKITNIVDLQTEIFWILFCTMGMGLHQGWGRGGINWVFANKFHYWYSILGIKSFTRRSLNMSYIVTIKQIKFRLINEFSMLYCPVGMAVQIKIEPSHYFWKAMVF